MTDLNLSKKSKDLLNFFNPFKGNLYSHVNPWHAAMGTFTDQIGWKSDIPLKNQVDPEFGQAPLRSHVLRS